MPDPQGRSLVVELIDLVAECADAGGLDTAAETRPGADLAEALRAARRLLLHPRSGPARRAADESRRALVALRKAARSATELPPPVPSATDEDGETPPALDGIASIVARCEPTDRPMLGKAARGLLRLAASGEEPASVRASLRVAAGRLAAIADGSSSEPASDYADATRLIDRVSRASTRPPGEESRADVTAPASEPAGTPPAEADRSLLADFAAESSDSIQAAEAALLALESDPSQEEEINTVFRAFHTIKGTSGFLGLGPITELAHKAEDLLSRIRDGEIPCTGGYADLALRAIDALKDLLSGLDAAASGVPLTKPAGYDELVRVLADPESSGVSGDPGQAAVLMPRLGDLLVGTGQAERETVEAIASAPEEGPIGMSIVRNRVAGASAVIQALRAQQRIVQNRPEGGEASVRVRTDRLDRLVDSVGELVIAHSMLAQDEQVRLDDAAADLPRKVSHAGKIVRELQDLGMSMRMVPLKGTFQRMARLVRDLAHRSGRPVEFATEGDETEIDRGMVDALADPLVHMVRNAVDHGIEPAEERLRAGKPPVGRVRLSACHAAGQIVVRLSDDGRGLDRRRIARKAIERGLIESDAGMSDGEVFRCIFEPGFSTAETITEVSGRGVGMDVVRRAVQALRGRIEIESEPGRGTTFVVKLPLTLAVTDGMIIRVGTQRFIVPTIAIHLTLRPEPAAISTVIGRGEMLNLRGTLIPIVRLHRLFGIDDALQDPTEALLVVVEGGERRVAVMVDELVGQQQVVAKSLGESMGALPGIAGAAILGDGRVGLILDAAGVIELSRGGGSGGAERERAAAQMLEVADRIAG